MGARQDIVEAVQAGREAGARGDHVTACPYPATSLLRRAWFRGYAEARPLTEQDGDA
ncbi:Rmf/CrpP fold protein [Streptomyces sp. enrichment culture]|uniref:Rmf/CrpP fold protein n=1 Tax=Streptomyces sp. enrichment culture TaxID=1795815 RepID=UPI003F57D11E